MILGLVPARGGSKGIKKKNIKELLGKPLIAYSIEQGLASTVIDKVVVSTDDAEIADIARAAGAEVPFMRPAELARDDTPMFPVMEH
ncbi:N-Acetylneuraminate cytidylyltransferase, partial [hydrothermal vent metagenome]